VVVFEIAAREYLDPMHVDKNDDFEEVLPDENGIRDCSV
jgi:hypothetical protein